MTMIIQIRLKGLGTDWICEPVPQNVAGMDL